MSEVLIALAGLALLVCVIVILAGPRFWPKQPENWVRPGQRIPPRSPAGGKRGF